MSSSPTVWISAAVLALSILSWSVTAQIDAGIIFANETDQVVANRVFNETVRFYAPRRSLTVINCSFPQVSVVGGVEGAPAVQLAIHFEDVLLGAIFQFIHLNLDGNSTITLKNVQETRSVAKHMYAENIFSNTTIVLDDVYAWQVRLRNNKFADVTVLVLRRLRMPTLGTAGEEGNIALSTCRMRNGSSLLIDQTIGSSLKIVASQISEGSIVAMHNSHFVNDPLCRDRNCDVNVSWSTLDNAMVELNNVTIVGGTLGVYGTEIRSSRFAVVDCNITHIEPTEQDRSGIAVSIQTSTSVDSSTLEFINSTIVSVPADPGIQLHQAGGLYKYGGPFRNSTLRLVNCSLSVDRGPLYKGTALLVTGMTNGSVLTLVAVIGSSRPTSSAGCAAQFGFLALVMALYGAFVAWRRPFRAAMLNGGAVASTLSLVGVAATSAAQAAGVAPASWSGRLMLVWIYLQMLVTLSRLGFVIVKLFLEAKLTRRVGLVPLLRRTPAHWWQRLRGDAAGGGVSGRQWRELGRAAGWVPPAGRR